ncbi:hypothetical protein C440_10418 [Haloferax mucosum ATCC BAA-1512]|uniref:Uncharacterized protein n=1 Tax=Haloferax mucosum ATCC BAA-1512 TaxID=662479 RepID=M0IDB0_9EURY|nr:hypothetical protein [Haloferax mucosum]ELZ94027.1 hypothetical protein C440_10418 [Haloferax mucosum ATCC BAA-1512]
MEEPVLDIDEQFADALVSTCRTTLGDSLRSVIYFTRDDFEVLYVRTDLYGDEGTMRAAKSELVENERVGFGPQETYSRGNAESDPEADANAGPDFGEYEFTLRVFSEGFVGRVVGGDRGVIVTTDELELTEFEEMEVALRRMLAEDDSE